MKTLKDTTLPIYFDTLEIDYSLNKKEEITNWLSVVLDEKVTNFDITYIFTNDANILKINQEYLNHDYYTDIITFNNSIDEQNLVADIFISLDTVKSNAEKLGVDFADELHRVIVHGILHLIGYNDKSDEEQTEMTKMEDYWLAKFE